MIIEQGWLSPFRVQVETEGGWQTLESSSGGVWGKGDIQVRLAAIDDNSASVELVSPTQKPLEVQLAWKQTKPLDGVRILCDHWERSYGDLEWRGMIAERPLPWYFVMHDGSMSAAAGVKVQPGAFCSWRVNPARIELHCDVRSGNRPLALGNRALKLATVVRYVGDTFESPYQVATSLCKRLSTSPRVHEQPLYGFNDWYYQYTKCTAASTLRDADLLGKLTQGLSNRPFCVIDAGWQVNSWTGGPHEPTSGKDFKEYGMARLAADIRKRNVKPGIWVRLTNTKDATGLVAATTHRKGDDDGILLDPSHETNRENFRSNMKKLVHEWGYDLIKVDFSGYDIMGKWGFQMGTHANSKETLQFVKDGLTTAEVMMDFYRDLRSGAGDSATILGCNTFGHLGAGIFDIQRTADDTSGQSWEPNRKMGVNTLAFRACQQGSFFEVDGDCVGITEAVPWNLNKQWLDLVARSGTALFVSPDPRAMNDKTLPVLKEALERASQRQDTGEPLDWQETTTPGKWLFGGEVVTYDWYEEPRTGY